jgi:putative PIN family toxin of toxin-antitoxin system
MIVVLDCNVWVSLTINSTLKWVSQLFDNGVMIASCSELRNEVTDVLSRPKLSKFLGPNSSSSALETYDFVTTKFNLSFIPKIISDEKDDYLFALCARSKASYLVTGDKLLLNVAVYKHTTIISLADFRRLVK